ncbi:hypothetical protein P4268_22780 [Bacillus thuringiensis]|nr:hypothetical protein [Bacillus thuringiensis]
MVLEAKVKFELDEEQKLHFQNIRENGTRSVLLSRRIDNERNRFS